MRFASFRAEGQDRYGLVDGLMVSAVPGDFEHTDLKAAIAGDALDAAAAAAQRSGHSFDLASVVFLPVIPNPDKIICVGLNYRSHGGEMGRPEYPAVFIRFANTQIGHLAPLQASMESDNFDFEGELAAIIGRGGRAIAVEDALEHVVGYSCYNDATMRDWQKHSSQYSAGKNFPGTGAFGPFLVGAREVGDPTDLGISARVDGVVMQQASTGEMLFSVAELIAYISRFCLLAPGDVIVTGTPSGSGSSRMPKSFLKPGMTVEVEIGRVGLLRNTVMAGDGP